MWWPFVSCWFFVLIDFTESIKKVPYRPGTICNFEEYNNSQSSAINRYFCVQDTYCRNSIQHSPLMHYEGCNRFMQSSNGGNLVCCHQNELQEDLSIHYTNLNYLPGIRSFLMCKEFSHAICGAKGSYCDVDVTEPEQFNGLPTAISKYPHTALIGYFHSTEKVWRWFCQGSIVSKSYILTAWSCMTDGSEPATNVKIGESRICPQDHCPDRDEEQNLVIILKSRYGSDRPSRHDLALVQVSHTISFNKNVRPACLYYELNTRQSQGWFARYGKPDTLMKTEPGERPQFMNPKDKKTIAFKVKTAGEAKIMFSMTGLPYKKEFHYEIVLGWANNSESKMSRSDEPNYSRPPTPTNITTQILSSTQFRGFWINFKPHEVFVGKEDSADSFLWYSDDTLDFSLPAMGISTAHSTGEWIINDYTTLASLHDFEMVDTDSDGCMEASEDTNNPVTNDDSKFCAISAKRNFGPCDNDWGGAIQIMEDEFYCMWQIFGVYIPDGGSPKNCSKVVKPSLFKLINVPGVLDWIEEIIFPDFSITNICLEQPVCTGTNTGFKGSCKKPL